MRLTIALTLIFTLSLPVSAGNNSDNEPVEVRVERMRQEGMDRRLAAEIAERRRQDCERERIRQRGTVEGALRRSFGSEPKEPCR